MVKAALAVVVAAATACTYAARFEDCAVACRGIGDCPADYVCGPEGYCRNTSGPGGTCAEVRGDAGFNDTDGPAGGRCTGTPTACSTFVPMGDCLGQDGCTFTPSTCTLTTNCSAITTNNQCMNTPGCATDFTTSTCKPVAGYCHGSTKPICEAIESCAYAGGCAGTPNACASYASDESGCRTQGGCDWN
jgi:hypothetical protein